MGGRATSTPPRVPENSRDDRGRFKPGTSGNPRGALPLTPERRAVRDLAAAERATNVATLVAIRDKSQDEWARIEACKLLLQYSDGKPVTAVGPMLAVQFNQGTAVPAFGTHSDPIDTVVSLATEGHLMSEEQRDQIVASIYTRANRAAQRAARPAIEAPAPAEKVPPPGAPPPPADCAAPVGSPVALERPPGAPAGALAPVPDEGAAPELQQPESVAFDSAGCPTGDALLAGQRAREAAAARERAEGAALAEALRQQAAVEAAERARGMDPVLERMLAALRKPSAGV